MEQNQMPDGNNPQGGTAESEPVPSMSDEELDGALDGLLDDPEEDTGEQEEKPQDDAGEEPETDDEEDQPDEEDDDRPRDEKGRFVSGEDAKVKLPDGSVTTVRDLIAGNQRQADYTRKTQELAEQRRSVDEGNRRVQQLEHQLAQERDWTQQVLNYFSPKKPTIEELDTDPIGYQQRNARWEEHQTYLRSLSEQQRQAVERQQQHSQQEMQQYLTNARQQLFERLPEFKDEKKFEAFRSEAKRIGSDVYGFSPDEIGSIMDPRLVHALSDAVKWQRFKAQKAQAAAKTEGKPPVSPGRRQEPKAVAQRDLQKAKDQLRTTRGHGPTGEAAMDKLLDRYV